MALQGTTKMNLEIKGWAKDTTGDLKREFKRLNIVHREDSPSKEAAVDLLLNKFGQRAGMVNKVSFKFPRHMVFVHKGVGKGRPISKPGTAKEWFNPKMDQDIEKLADIVADNQADIVVGNLLIK